MSNHEDNKQEENFEHVFQTCEADNHAIERDHLQRELKVLGKRRRDIEAEEHQKQQLLDRIPEAKCPFGEIVECPENDPQQERKRARYHAAFSYLLRQKVNDGLVNLMPGDYVYARRRNINLQVNPKSPFYKMKVLDMKTISGQINLVLDEVGSSKDERSPFQLEIGLFNENNMTPQHTHVLPFILGNDAQLPAKKIYDLYFDVWCSCVIPMC